MSKLKADKCPKCKLALSRHDTNRISIRVGNGSRGQGVFKNYHLSCYQELTDVVS